MSCLNFPHIRFRDQLAATVAATQTEAAKNSAALDADYWYRIRCRVVSSTSQHFKEVDHTRYQFHSLGDIRSLGVLAALILQESLNL